MKLMSNPEGCPFGETDCLACYWSKVDQDNTWRGSQRCWDAQCLVAAPKPEPEPAAVAEGR